MENVIVRVMETWTSHPPLWDGWTADCGCRLQHHGHGIRRPGTLCFGHHDHCARAASCESGFMVDFERGSTLAWAGVRERVTDRDLPAARASGLPDDGGNLPGTHTAKLPGVGGEA